MDQSIPLYIVMIGLAVAGVLYLLHRWIASIQKSAGRISDSNDNLLSAINVVAGELNAVRISLSAAADALCQEMAASAGRAEVALATASAGMSRAGDALMPAAEALRANMSAVPSLLEAVAKVGQAQLEVQQRMQQEAEQKKKNPFGRANGPAAPRDINAANEEYEVSMMMRAEGITREEAMLRRNPANQSSVWDGGQIFENWRQS